MRLGGDMGRGADSDPYRRLFETMLEGAVVLDAATGRVVLANRAAAAMLGFDRPEELAGQDPLDFIPRQDRSRIVSVIATSIEGQHNDPAELQVLTRDKGLIWVSATAAEFHDDGRPAVIATMRDITAEKAKDAALRMAEESQMQLIDAASDAIYILQDEKIAYVNPAGAKGAGLSQEELVGLPFIDLVHPDSRQQVIERHEKISMGQFFPGLTTVKGIDARGRTRWANIQEIPYSWRGRPATMSLISDVTERVLAEQSLKHEEERLRAIMENAWDGVAIFDQNFRVMFESPSLARMTGYSPDEWTGITPDKFEVHHDDLRPMLAQLEALRSRPGSFIQDVVIRYRRRDGSWRTMEAAGRNLLDDPKVKGVVINFRDITERKKAEDSLRRSEERFRSLVETSSDWVWEIDSGNRYTYVSPKVREILGHEPQDLLGRTPFEFMHQREGRRVSTIMRRFAAEHLPFSLLENTATHQDGRAVVLESSAVPITDSTGRLAGYRGINRDITERKKVEQELQRSLRRLEKTMESTIEAITTTIETRDPYTTGHQMRVTGLACAIAKVMEVPPTRIEGIRVAGLLHDIGKIAVPTEILSKPGKLNEVEYEMIKTHAKIGYNILKKIEFPWPVARTVLQHHERWNGSGYPYGVRGEDILLEARILAVADVMEAMSSHRPYRPSIGADRALDEIAVNSGLLYDPAVASACVAAFSESGFEFSAALPGGATAETEVAPAERHIRDSQEDH